MLSRMPVRLYTPKHAPGWREVLWRAALVNVLVLAVTIIVYFEGGLIDGQTGERPGFWDCLYFAIVTVTTVGYGDIVPVGTTSRLTDALVLTPVRFVVIATVFGTAYQIAIQRFQEEFRMKQKIAGLKNHIMLCGFGTTGRAILRELLLQGQNPSQIVVIDTSELALEEAASHGVLAFSGDARREHTLKELAIDRAEHIFVCPGRDDTAVLIVLTARALNPDAQVVAMCHDSENVKLLERSGAHQIVNPTNAGGTMMANATRRVHLVDTMSDLLTVGGDLCLNERTVGPDEVGKRPNELSEISIVRVYRGEEQFNVGSLPTLEAGDIIVFVSPRPIGHVESAA